MVWMILPAFGWFPLCTFFGNFNCRQAGVLIVAHQRSSEEAAALYSVSSNMARNVYYERLFDDRYKLDVMREFKIQQPVYKDIINEGAQKNWW